MLMKILLTGAAGFIASHVAELLFCKGRTASHGQAVHYCVRRSGKE
jgi:nucleoside-diphosphate-sugar epimerase